MSNEIIDYLSKYVSLSSELKTIVNESSIVKNFKKGSILLREGQISNECFLVLKGCVRSYLLVNGEEKSLDFYTEEYPILPISYGKNIASQQYLVCVEDSILMVNTPEHESNMLVKYPQFEIICRIMTEVMMANFQESSMNYRISNPLERYLFLEKKRPDLFQRVPQYQLASYLGIKPESLSRLRKRLTKKQGLL
jgi:CRP-like cAMP-binding protein